MTPRVPRLPRSPRPHRSHRLLGATALVGVLALAGCGGGSDESASDTSTESSSPSSTTSTITDGPACTYVQGGGRPTREVDLPPDQAAYGGEVPVTIETTAGTIDVELDADAAPCTVNSFTSLAAQGYYDDTPCHRLTTQGIFVLQCGDPSGTGAGGPGYSFADELTGQETYPAGTLAMANAGPDTNGSQFFMVYEKTPLPPSYTVFGTIGEDGLAVVQKVADAGAEGGAPDGAPAEPIDLTSVSVD